MCSVSAVSPKTWGALLPILIRLHPSPITATKSVPPSHSQSMFSKQVNTTMSLCGQPLCWFTKLLYYKITRVSPVTSRRSQVSLHHPATLVMQTFLLH